MTETLESYLRSKIVGQNDVLKEFCALMDRSISGFRYPDQPIASVLMLGPTGVGKTASAILAAEHLFGKDGLGRFDMSEYMTVETIDKLLGSPGHPGIFEIHYESTGCQGFMLFDELEKAHTLILDVLHQILSAGRVTLSGGKTLDLTAYVIAATSNLGGRVLMDSKFADRDTIVDRARREALKVLRPEIFARFELKAVFNKLDYEATDEITRIHVDQCLSIAGDLGHCISITEKAIQSIRAEGYDERFGARPIRNRAMEVIGNAVLKAQNITPGRISGLLDYDPKTASYGIL